MEAGFSTMQRSTLLTRLPVLSAEAWVSLSGIEVFETGLNLLTPASGAASIGVAKTASEAITNETVRFIVGKWIGQQRDDANKNRAQSLSGQRFSGNALNE
jgi:hypothetical protein